MDATPRAGYRERMYTTQDNPTTLLGQLQRGRGLGFLRVCEADSATVHAALLACLARDPRREPDFESRAPYYAALMSRTAMDLGQLATHLSQIDLEAAKRGDKQVRIAAIAQGDRFKGH